MASDIETPMIIAGNNQSNGTSTKNKSSKNHSSHVRSSKNVRNEYVLELPQTESSEDGHSQNNRSGEMDVHARRKLIIASVLCLVFMCVEAVGGVLSNSVSIATDAVHLLTDFAGFMISLTAIWFAGRPPTHKMSFGWYRLEVLAAVVSVLMTWAITAILVYIAVLRFIGGDFEVNAKVMMITSSFGILENIFIGCTLRGSHGHSHGTSVGNKVHDHNKNMIVRAASIHVLGDILQSIGVFCAAITIYLKPDWVRADPICTFMFAIIVLCTTIPILKDGVLVLMEASPSFLDHAEVMEALGQVDGVDCVDNLRIWSLSIDKIALSAHLKIAPDVDPGDVLKRAKSAIQMIYEFFETTLEIECVQAIDNSEQSSGPPK